MDDDAEMVAAAADGDERAFRELVERHYDACLRYATRMLGDRSDAEDVVQDAFVRAYRSLRSYREQGRFRSWLFRILVNRCRSAVERRGRRAATMAREEEVGEAALVHHPREQAPFRTASVRRALATLPGPLREAFLLKFVEEWTYEEMTRMTGASVSALKMRVARAREALREQLQEVADEEG